MYNIVGASLSKQLPWLHMNRLSFTLKSWAELLVFMSAAYAQALPEIVSNWHVKFVRSASSLAIDGQSVAAVTNRRVRCCTSFNLRRLRYGYRRCTLALAQHCLSPIEATYTKWTRTTYTSCNAVLLVWGSLRLSPRCHCLWAPRLSLCGRQWGRGNCYHGDSCQIRALK